MKKNGYMERSADLAGASDVKLGLWLKVRSFESGDSAEVQVSSDGSNYTVLQTLTPADSDNQYHFYEFDLSSFNMTADFRVRIESYANNRKDYLYIDDVEFIGIP